MNFFSPETKTALVVGHPGHELRVFHWLEMMRPTVFVLTDGSGSLGQSRLPSTTRILDQVSAAKGSFYGRLTDKEAYRAILDRQIDLFGALVHELAEHFLDEQVEYVAGDAREGYNPSHDVCRLLIDAAVEAASRRSGRRIGNFEFVLTGAPDNFPEHGGNGATGANGFVRLQLDDPAFARKMTAAHCYAELHEEVEDAIAQNRVEAFRLECLRPVTQPESLFARDHKPYYEQHGENRVADGHYREVIRYREHFLPLAEGLWQQIEKGL